MINRPTRTQTPPSTAISAIQRWFVYVQAGIPGQTAIHSLSVSTDHLDSAVPTARHAAHVNLYGIRTRAELLADGVPASTIDDRCRRGLYTRLLPQTYCLGPVTGLARCAAIVAWIPNATLSHRTAAWMQNMLPEPEQFEATIPRSLRRDTPDWLTLYRRNLPPDAINDEWGLPVTHAARTLLDCLAVMPRSAADQLVDAHLGRSISPNDVRALCHSGGRGTPELRNQLRNAATHAASEPERLFARALHRRGLHLLANHPVGPYTCDFVHERSRTIIEIDGREFHSSPETFRRDRRRQNWLLLDDWLILRYAAADIFQHLDRCADEAITVIRSRTRYPQPAYAATNRPQHRRFSDD